MSDYIIYTDGACTGNPGAGGWGAYIHKSPPESPLATDLCGGAAQTTNNRMELTAPIEVLKLLPDASRITLITDSVYVKDGITKWIHGWKRNGWRTANRKPVKNDDLWRALDAQAARHKIDWQWVKGHAGEAGNERADALANQGMAAFR